MPYTIEEAYSLLGLPPGSNLQAVKARYRQLVRLHHPDRYSDATEKKQAEERLKKLNNARQLLENYLQTQHKESSEATKTYPPKTKDTADDNRQNQEKDNTEKANPWEERLTDILAALIALLDNYVKGAEKKHPWSKALDELGAPIKVTAAARKRRYWGMIFFLLLFESLFCHFFAGDQASLSPEKSKNSPGADRLESTQPTPLQSAAANRRTTQFDRLYWLKIRLDRDLRAIDLNKNSITEVDAALTNPLLQAADKRMLLALKANHRRSLEFATEDGRLTQQDIAALQNK